MSVGIASAWRNNKCWEDADSCWGKEDRLLLLPVPATGVGGGKNALLGTAEWAPPGGGAKDVKLMPPVAPTPATAPPTDGAEGKSGAGGIVQEDAAEVAADCDALDDVDLLWLLLLLLLPLWERFECCGPVAAAPAVADPAAAQL